MLKQLVPVVITGIIVIIIVLCMRIYSVTKEFYANPTLVYTVQDLQTYVEDEIEAVQNTDLKLFENIKNVDRSVKSQDDYFKNQFKVMEQGIEHLKTRFQAEVDDVEDRLKNAKQELSGLDTTLANTIQADRMRFNDSLSKNFNTLSTALSNVDTSYNQRVTGLDNMFVGYSNNITPRMAKVETDVDGVKEATNALGFSISNTVIPMINTTKDHISDISTSINPKITDVLSQVANVNAKLKEQDIFNMTVSNVSTRATERVDQVNSSIMTLSNMVGSYDSRFQAQVAFVNTLNDSILAVKDKVSVLKKNVEDEALSIKKSFATGELSVSDFLFGYNKALGRFEISAPTNVPKKDIFMASAMFGEAVNVAQGGKLNFAGVDAPYTIQVANPNEMHWTFPTRESHLKLHATGDGSGTHVFDGAGMASHTGGIVTPFVKIGDFTIKQQNDTLVIKKSDSQETWLLNPEQVKLPKLYTK